VSSTSLATKWMPKTNTAQLGFFFAFLPIRTLEHKVPGYSTQAVMGFSKFILGFSLKIWHS